MKKQDRQETVMRIARIQEYQKEKVMEKIESDNERSARILAEKAALLETRQKLRKQVDFQKQRAIEAFERMKKKGKLDVFY
jgi:hypothetical protein